MPTAERCCRSRKIHPASDTSAGYSATILRPAAPAMPAIRRLGAHRTRFGIRLAPMPASPSPLRHVPAYASLRFPSALRCRPGCARFWWGLQWCCPILFFLMRGQPPRTDRFVQRVGQYLQFTGYFRHTSSFFQQHPRPLQYFSLQHRCRTLARLGLVKSFRAVDPKHFHVSLHRDDRYAKGLHDFFRLHRPVDDHLAREHPETSDVFFLVMEYRQVPVNVDHLACFLLNRDAVVDLRYPGGKYWQLSLRHPWVLALAQDLLQPFFNRFRLIPFSSNQQIHWARSGGLILPNTERSSGCLSRMSRSSS